MKNEIYFLSSNDPRLKRKHIEQAAQIAEAAFQTQTDGNQMEVGPETVEWTLKHIPHCWSLVLMGDDCVGGAAVLPSTSMMMNAFLAGEVNESALLKFAKENSSDIQKFDCLYLAGITVKPDLHGYGFGTKVLEHAIEKAVSAQPRLKTFFTWIYSESGAKLMARLQSSYLIHTYVPNAA